MATTIEYVDYVLEQIKGVGEIRYRKMFGEFTIYINDKPILLACDNTIYVKKLECIAELMKSADTAIPYEGAKERFVLDIDNKELSMKVISILDSVTPLPKPKKKKQS